MRIVISVVATSLMVVPAAATGGLSCQGSDDNGDLRLESGVTRGMGSPLFGFRGEVDIRAAGIPADLRKISFSDAHVPQYWLDGEGLRLHLYRERDAGKPHGYVELIIMTAPASDETTLEGGYTMAVFDIDGTEASLAGKVTCFVE